MRVMIRTPDAKKVIKGLECCSFDADVLPVCNMCPYGFRGKKCEDDRTGVRCCNELKADALALLRKGDCNERD